MGVQLDRGRSVSTPARPAIAAPADVVLVDAAIAVVVEVVADLGRAVMARRVLRCAVGGVRVAVRVGVRRRRVASADVALVDVAVAVVVDTVTDLGRAGEATIVIIVAIILRPRRIIVAADSAVAVVIDVAIDVVTATSPALLGVRHRGGAPDEGREEETDNEHGEIVLH